MSIIKNTAIERSKQTFRKGIPAKLVLVIFMFSVLIPAFVFSQPDSTKKSANPIMAIFLTETVAFGSAFSSTFQFGDEAIGILYGASGLAVLVVPFLLKSDSLGSSYSELAWPQFTIPYGVGLLALSYYNFRYGDSHSDHRKFRTNAIGFNAVVLLSVASAILLDSHALKYKRFLRLSITPSSIHLNFDFVK
jgi:hypothetical protein